MALGFLRTNICSIRSVTTKPPTRLTAASTIATSPTASATPLSVVPVTRIAPSRMIPWMALAPDISGVCSVEETLEITSMPTNTLSTKMVSQVMASFTARPLPRSRVPRSRCGSARA